MSWSVLANQSSMARLLIIALYLFTQVSCSKSKEELPTLPPAVQQIIDENQDCVCLPYIDLHNWNKQEIYLLGFKGPTCNWIPGYYDSKGNSIEMESGYTLDKFLAESVLQKHIWSCVPGNQK